MVPWNSTSVGLKTETTKIHFLSDVLVAVTSLDLKVPGICSEDDLRSRIFGTFVVPRIFEHLKNGIIVHFNGFLP